MKRKYEVGYNKDWALKAGRVEFLKQMDAAYPDHKDAHRGYADAHLPEKKKPETTS